MLVLAGPRRHYLIDACNRYGIPYVFCGDEAHVRSGKDDILVNNLPPVTMNLLYNLIDLYIVTSKSEGGPKALIEAPLAGTAILATDAGMAIDILDQRSIANDVESFVQAIDILERNKQLRNEIEQSNFTRIRNFNNYPAYKNRVQDILIHVLKDKVKGSTI